MFTDSHLHLNRHEFAGEAAAVLARAAAAGVNRFMNVGYDPASSAASVALAERDPRVLATVGVHPHDASLLADPAGGITGDGERVLDELGALARHPRVAAVGEIGLDFYRDLSPRPAQMAAFAAQVALANRLDLPVVLHIREAYDEIIALMEQIGLPRRRGIMHSFAGDGRAAAWGVANGFLLGIGGPVTYRNSRLPAVLSDCAPENLVLETDAPWLPPEPHRGRRNEPAYLVHTARAVADLFDMPLAELADVTNGNFARFSGCGTRT
ncbi:TatD family hydrolase [bacterium]|nr:TatD family hydrolase [bacterium]MBU1073115.1 TatD family hydrolase [bacterium]